MDRKVAPETSLSSMTMTGATGTEIPPSTVETETDIDTYTDIPTESESVVQISEAVEEVDDELVEMKLEAQLQERKQEEEENERFRAKLRELRMKKWRTKKCILLSMFILAFFIGAGCSTKWWLAYKGYDWPASDFGVESTNGGMLCFFGLTLIAPFGFVILSFRISNILLGLVFMFWIILVIAYATLCVSRAVSSQILDRFYQTMQIFVTKMVKSKGDIPEFHHQIQERCDCCGFHDIDRILDWPQYIGKEGGSNLPYSCCISKEATRGTKRAGEKDIEKRTEICKGLGRTFFDKFRVPGGFTMYADDVMMKLWAKGADFRKDYNVSNVQAEVDISSENASFIPQLLKLFVKKVHDQNSKTVDNKIVLSSFRNWTGESGPGLVLEAPAFPGEVELHFDRFVEELIYANRVIRGEFVYFEIPLVPESQIIPHRVPYRGSKQINNFTRNSRFIATKATTTTTPGPDPNPVPDPTTMPPEYFIMTAYYVTKGLPENFQLEGVVKPWRCDRQVKEDGFLGYGIKGKEKCIDFAHKENIKLSTFAKSMNLSKFVEWEKERNSKASPTEIKNSDSTSLSRAILEFLMWWNIGLGVGVIVTTLCLALIFWYFYSRLKAEEQADLKLPTDFDLLHLDQLAFGDMDDASKKLEKELLKMRMHELQERAKHELEKERLHHAYTVVPVSLMGHAVTNPIEAGAPPKTIRQDQVSATARNHDIEHLLEMKIPHVVHAEQAIRHEIERMGMIMMRPSFSKQNQPPKAPDDDDDDEKSRQARRKSRKSKESLRAISKKRVNDISKKKSVNDINKKKSVNDINKKKSVNDISKKKSVKDIQSKKSMSKIKDKPENKDQKKDDEKKKK